MTNPGATGTDAGDETDPAVIERLAQALEQRSEGPAATITLDEQAADSAPSLPKRGR